MVDHSTARRPYYTVENERCHLLPRDRFLPVKFRTSPSAPPKHTFHDTIKKMFQSYWHPNAEVMLISISLYVADSKTLGRMKITSRNSQLDPSKNLLATKKVCLSRPLVKLNTLPLLSHSRNSLHADIRRKQSPIIAYYQWSSILIHQCRNFSKSGILLLTLSLSWLVCALHVTLVLKLKSTWSSPSKHLNEHLQFTWKRQLRKAFSHSKQTSDLQQPST